MPASSIDAACPQFTVFSTGFWRKRRHRADLCADFRWRQKLFQGRCLREVVRRPRRPARGWRAQKRPRPRHVLPFTSKCTRSAAPTDR